MRIISIALVLALGPMTAQVQSLTPAVSGPLAAPATLTPPEQVIDLAPYRTRWVVKAEIGGQSRRLLFDTGAGNTHIGEAVAREGGCTPWGRLAGFNMMAKRIDSARCDGFPIVLGGKPYMSPAAGVLNLGDISATDADLDGVLGLDIFEQKAITLDLRGGHIVVESDASLVERTRTMQPIPIRLAREAAEPRWPFTLAFRPSLESSGSSWTPAMGESFWSPGPTPPWSAPSLMSTALSPSLSRSPPAWRRAAITAMPQT